MTKETELSRILGRREQRRCRKSMVTVATLDHVVGHVPKVVVWVCYASARDTSDGAVPFVTPSRAC
jgi:hypothetical protein